MLKKSRKKSKKNSLASIIIVRCIVNRYEKLIDGIMAVVLLADRDYDSGKVVEKAEKAGMKVVIPPCKNRKIQRNMSYINFAIGLRMHS